jgi:hypothetical protein
MPDISPQGTDDTPLSISEAANAYAGLPETEELEESQPDVEDAPEGDDSLDDQPDPDEGDGEEGEGDPEDEGQAEEGDEDPDPAGGQYVSPKGKVRLPDGSEMLVADLIQGNLRDRDYRQKTMETADIKRTLETQSLSVKQREDKVAEQAEYVSSLLQSIIPPAPDPAMADPNSDKFDLVAYNYQRATREQWLEHLHYLNGQEQQRKSVEAEESVKGKKERADAEWTLALEKVPEFKDEKRVKAFVERSFEHGAAYGFTKAEIADALAMDHRQLLVIKDAIAWRQHQANKAKVSTKIEGKPPVLKGGQRSDPSRTKARDTRAAMDRLNQTGSLKDGIAALLATEGKG